MAEQINDFTLKNRGRKAEEIDWDTYLDGSTWSLKAGTDFKSKITTFRQKASREARARGGAVETRADNNKGVVQIKYNKNGKPAAKKPAAKPAAKK